jgi:hypothetical protein
MKKIVLITVLSFYGLQAQMGVNVVVGAAYVNFVSEDEYENTQLKPVIAVPEIAVEKKLGPVVAGVGYYSGGYTWSGSDITTSVKLDYLSLYGIVPLFLGPVGIGAGLGIGIPMGGILESEYAGEKESVDFESDDLEIDQSLILGAGIQFTEQIGVRTYLRMGLVDIFTIPWFSASDVTNAGLGVALSYSF